MKKICIFLLLAMVCTGVVTAATYSYSVDGKVYLKGTTIPVSNVIVTFSIGSSLQYSSVSARDGSFYFSYQTLSFNPVGSSMKLKASTGICTGATPWTCNGSSETKNVEISCNIAINPNLAVQFGAANFAHPGTQPPLTVAAHVDEPTMDVRVQQFNVAIAWNPAAMNLADVQTSPGSNFEVTGWALLAEPGKAQVQGQVPAGGDPVKLPIPPNPPESFFDVFFVIPAIDKPSYTPVSVDETTELINDGVVQNPYPSQTILLLGEPEKPMAGLLIRDFDDWSEALEGERPELSIRPMSIAKWDEYMRLWHDPGTEKEGLPYPETTFVPCDPEAGTGMLYPWGGGGGGAYDEPGLVMVWQYDDTTEGNYASAWEWDYGEDPDLTNCTIQVTVTPPAGVNITAVSFSIVDIGGLMRTWWWSVPTPIPQGIATTVKINTAMTGINASTPVATGYMNAPGFNLAQSQFFDVDENFNYIFGQHPVPPLGQSQIMAWNYWHNLIVTKNTNVRKWFYIKYGQKPALISDEDQQPPLISGWDELSVYQPQPNPIMADDWPCYDDRPITDIHWWGSFIGWTQPHLPPVLPKAFHIGIWTDVPDPDPSDPQNYSHPGKLIWENTCTSWAWNFAGYDVDPRLQPMEDEACFQFTQLLSEDEWFYQQPNADPEIPNVYWLSIAAIYDSQAQVQYPWGWKTRPHAFNDDAVRILETDIWPPKIGASYTGGVPIQLPAWPDPTGVSWDLAFELSTNQPKPPASADLNFDGFVDLADFSLFAQQWLTTGMGW